jgi:hypothetical protein
MKKIIFTFILVGGLAFAASAQSNNESAVQVQTAGQTVSESAATPVAPGQDKMNETPADKANCGTKNTSSSGKKKCCADGKKASANCHEVKSDMKKEEKISE